MKNIFISIALLVIGVSHAQVVISEDPNAVPTNSSVLLEFGNLPKGIILPSVAEATGAVAGTFIVNTTDRAVQYFDGIDWINLTYPNELVGNSFVGNSTADIGQGVIIGATSSAKPGVLVLESTTKALVLPKVANPHLNILSPIAGTMVYDTTSDSLAVYDGKEWSFWAAN